MAEKPFDGGRDDDLHIAEGATVVENGREHPASEALEGEWSRISSGEDCQGLEYVPLLRPSTS